MEIKTLKKQILHTWALNKSSESYLAYPASINELLQCYDHANSRHLSICPKGGGNSFGDVFMLNNHMVVDLSRINRIKEFHEESGILIVETGALVRDILSLTMLYNWYLSGISGSMNDTVGGVLSSNSTGKDSWEKGNFINNIVSFKLLLADGSIIDVDRENKDDLFNAVIGGLGILGIVIEVTLQLKKIPSFMVTAYTQKVDNFSELKENYYGTENNNRDLFYTWVDAFPDGRFSGKGIIKSAKFINPPHSVTAEKFQQSLIPKSRIFMLKPETFWPFVRYAWSTRVLKTVNRSKHIYASIPNSKSKTVMFSTYHYVTAHLPKFNLKYYPQGFMEIQALFSRSIAVQAFQALFSICRNHSCYPELSVVKRHIPDSGYLSFAGDGMSIAINFSVNNLSNKQMKKYTSELEETILKHKGKVHLAKHPFLSKDAFMEMYPDYKKIVALKEKYDPNRFFWSDAFERLLS